MKVLASLSAKVVKAIIRRDKENYKMNYIIVSARIIFFEYIVAHVNCHLSHENFEKERARQTDSQRVRNERREKKVT